MSEPCVILYGLPHSLYTAPVRAYLRKQAIAYVERSPRAEAFASTVAPVIGRTIVPVVVTPDGTIIQDSVDIIDHFEHAGVRASAYPTRPRQRLLALLLQLYGSQGLLRPAMHYRWSYYDRQARFLDHAFEVDAAGGQGGGVMRRMQAYLPGLGVTPQTTALIERSHERLLDRLDAHFTVSPYLFGGRPSVGDYGLLGPLFAHLGRDPVPAGLMKTRAPAVFRWVERMNAPDPDLTDFPDHADAFAQGDDTSDTLRALVLHMGEDVAGEFAAKLAFLNEWAKTHQPADGDPVSPKAHRRSIGVVQVDYQGVSVQLDVQPYLLYLTQRVRAEMEALDETDGAWARDLLSECGLLAPIVFDSGFRVERPGHVEVWSRSHRPREHGISAVETT